MSLRRFVFETENEWQVPSKQTLEVNCNEAKIGLAGVASSIKLQPNATLSLTNCNLLSGSFFTPFTDGQTDISMTNLTGIEGAPGAVASVTGGSFLLNCAVRTLCILLLC